MIKPVRASFLQYPADFYPLRTGSLQHISGVLNHFDKKSGKKS